MATIRENLCVEDYIQETGKVKLAVNFNKINMLKEKNTNKTCTVKHKTCSVNKLLEQKIEQIEQIDKTDMIEAEVVLDKTTQSQLTPKFIKSQSKSEWVEIVKQIEQLYSGENLLEFDFVKANRTNTGYTRKLRNLKHGEQIHWIDSIYRNNLK